MAHGDRRFAVAGEDDLALLGELEPAVDGVRRLREDRRVGRPSAATERSAASVEQGQGDAGILRPEGDLLLRLVQREVRGDRADILGRVRVPEHDLQTVPGLGHACAELRELDDLGENLRCRLQVGECLEQRHDIEHRRVVAESVAGQAMHVREVFGGLRERDDVATGSAQAVGALDLSDRAEDLEHLFGAFAALAAGLEFCQRLAVHLRVLAHLELGEVETVGLDLPDEVLDAAERMPLRAGCRQRILHGAQVSEQLLRFRVAVRSARSGRGDALREREHHASVRLLGGTRGDLGRGIRLSGGERRPQRDDRLARRCALGVEREGAADPVEGAFKATQHVVGGDLRRLASDGCRHERVAVAVSADPRAHPHEGGDDGGARA